MMPIVDCRMIPFVIARLLVSRGDPGECQYVTGIRLEWKMSRFTLGSRSRLRLLRNDKKGSIYAFTQVRMSGVALGTRILISLSTFDLRLSTYIKHAHKRPLPSPTKMGMKSP